MGSALLPSLKMCRMADASTLGRPVKCPRPGTDRERSLAKVLSSVSRVFSLVGQPSHRTDRHPAFDLLQAP
jgi:hypothetical protein